MNDGISQIFDKILKRILLAMSSAAIIDLINGLFSEDFPLDSKISYNYTEDIDGNLKKTVADIIITIQTKDHIRRFHLEGQINDDETIVIRVFEYGFHDAMRHKITQGNKITLPFPTPVIIFLEHTESTPDEVILELDFGAHGKINYPVQAMKFLDYTVEELCSRKMIILLPLYLLKLRREVENAKRRKHQREATLRKNAKTLKELIDKKILPAIVESEKAGNITPGDVFELLRLLRRLYDYLYGGVELFKEEDINMLLSDILELEYDAELAEAAARVRAETTAKVTAEVTAGVTAQLTEQFAALRKQETLEEKRTMAKELKASGVAIEIITRTTKLPWDEVQNL